MVNDAEYWAHAALASKALSPFVHFGREMDSGRMNISMVHAGLLTLCRKMTSVLSANPGVLSREDQEAWISSIAQDLATYNRPVFQAAHFLTPCLLRSVQLLRYQDPELYNEMRCNTLAALLLLASRFDCTKEGLCLEQVREVPLELAEELDCELLYYTQRAGVWSPTNYDRQVPPRVFFNAHAGAFSFYVSKLLSIVPTSVNMEHVHQQYDNRPSSHLTDRLVRCRLSIGSTASAQTERDVFPSEILSLVEGDLSLTAADETAILADERRRVEKEREETNKEQGIQRIKAGLVAEAELDKEEEEEGVEVVVTVEQEAGELSEQVYLVEGARMRVPQSLTRYVPN